MTTRTASKFLDNDHKLLHPMTPICTVDLHAVRAHLTNDHGVQLMGAENAALLLTTHAFVHEGR